MRRFIISFVSIIILYVLQCTVFKGALLVAGVAPNLMLMFTCIVGFMRGRKSGMITGFAGGMLIDIMSGGMIGLRRFFICLQDITTVCFTRNTPKNRCCSR